METSVGACLLRYNLAFYTMPTELPYAADAEVSLSYDELQVRVISLRFSVPMLITETLFSLGAKITIPERTGTIAYHCSNQVQLCMGASEEPNEGKPGGRGAVIARQVDV